MEKKWKILDKIDESLRVQFPEINDVVLQLLYNRGLTDQAEIDDFLSPNYDEQILDPYLFKDMGKSVERIFQAVEKKEKVVIYGDYDADGVCSTAVLYYTLKKIGLDVEIRIPYRDVEGYGLNEEAVIGIVHYEFDLVITVDCGISNKYEIDILNKGGVDIIITDHHQEPVERPKAYAILNSTLDDSGYPFKKLAGAGVAFKLAQALIFEANKKGIGDNLCVGWEKWLLDLVAIATVGDMVPLIGENRILVKYGLSVLEKTNKPGLKLLVEMAKSSFMNTVDTQLIGWRIAPRLNAAGRIKDATVAYDILTTEDQSKINELADFLEDNNKQRQAITDKMLKEALGQIDENNKDKVIWAVGDQWAEGVVGLVAGRLCDRYHRPTLVVSKRGDIYGGSCRSVIEFNITEAMKNCGDVFVRFGGHAQAGGFQVKGKKNFDKFVKEMTKLANDQLKDTDLRPEIAIDAEIRLIDVNWELWDELERFEPFGEGNEKPLFTISKMKIEQSQLVGKDGKHLRLMTTQTGNAKIYKLIGFGFGDWNDKIKQGSYIDVVCEIDVNEWNGNRELQLKIVDLRLHEK
jgi:single-stranded-DNA-specific exonuclease